MAGVRRQQCQQNAEEPRPVKSIEDRRASFEVAHRTFSHLHNLARLCFCFFFNLFF